MADKYMKRCPPLHTCDAYSEGVGNRYPSHTTGQGAQGGHSLFGKQNGNTMHSSKERPRRAKDTEGEKGQEGDEKEAGMGNRTQANATSILQGLCPGQE